MDIAPSRPLPSSLCWRCALRRGPRRIPHRGQFSWTEMCRALTIEVCGRLPGTEAQGGGTVKAQGALGPGELTVQTGVRVSRVCVYSRFQKSLWSCWPENLALREGRWFGKHKNLTCWSLECSKPGLKLPLLRGRFVRGGAPDCSGYKGAWMHRLQLSRAWSDESRSS